MKKIFLLIAIVALMGSCKKEDNHNDVCPSVPAPQYSNTDYYLTNPSGFGEADTIRFNYDIVDDYYLNSSLMDSIHEQSQIDVSGAELTIKYHLNNTYTAFTDGSGNFGTKELFIYWRIANLDTTIVHTFYSVYSKCKIN